jgi:uncharacterized LabA/DUF88 family protein
MSEQEEIIRTSVFIDGYNLYYGRLKGSPYKWLDVVELMRHIVRVQHGDFEVTCVHYFSAPAKEAFATHGKESVIAQQSYHRALLAKYPQPLFRMTLGTHAYDRRGALLPRYVEGAPCDKTDRVRVWSLEEKQTDVNLALSMYRACAKRECDQVVVCSNDSDVEPALSAIRDDFPEVKIGVVTPADPADQHRRFSKSLASYADWARRYILDEELAAAQLPPHVPTNKKPARKPAHW